MILIYLANRTQFEIFNKRKFSKKSCLIFSTNLVVVYLCKINQYRIESLKYSAIQNVTTKKNSLNFFVEPIKNSYEYNLINEIYSNLHISIEHLFKKNNISTIYLGGVNFSKLSIFNSNNELDPMELDVFSQLFSSLILYEKSLSIGIEIEYL
jgi:hypothetical protein